MTIRCTNICWYWTRIVGVIWKRNKNPFLRATAHNASRVLANSYRNSGCPSVRPPVRLSRPGTHSSPGEIETRVFAVW